jgi:hypothetical protein
VKRAPTHLHPCPQGCQHALAPRNRLRAAFAGVRPNAGVRGNDRRSHGSLLASTSACSAPTNSSLERMGSPFASNAIR